MKALDLLKGKKAKVMTNAKVPVVLEIKEIKQETQTWDVSESNAANDWWPEQASRTFVKVTFTNGFVKEYDRFDDIEIVEP